MPLPNQNPFSSNLPTSKDSADLYNNAMSLLEFYSKSGKYKLTSQKLVNPSISSDSITKASLKDVKNFSKSKRFSDQLNRFLTPQDYYKPVDDNKYYKREKEIGVLNMDAPMGLYDKRIKPTKEYTFARYSEEYEKIVQAAELEIKKRRNAEQNKIKYSKEDHEKFASALQAAMNLPPLATDHATFYGYDPVLIKPFYMLTPEEKIARKKLEMTPEHIQAVKEQQSLAQTSTNNFTKNQKELLLKQKQLVEEIITPYGKMTAESYKKQFGQKAYERDFKVKK